MTVMCNRHDGDVTADCAAREQMSALRGEWRVTTEYGSMDHPQQSSSGVGRDEVIEKVGHREV